MIYQTIPFPLQGYLNILSSFSLLNINFILVCVCVRTIALSGQMPRRLHARTKHSMHERLQLRRGMLYLSGSERRKSERRTSERWKSEQRKSQQRKSEQRKSERP